jgi:hypothetical protein
VAWHHSRTGAPGVWTLAEDRDLYTSPKTAVVIVLLLVERQARVTIWPLPYPDLLTPVDDFPDGSAFCK